MMPPNGKKQRLPPPDVLGNLPESVIDEILIRLPLRDAVRTSILSKKWRYNWCRLPHLELDRTLWKTTKDLISPTIGFTNIVYHLLTLHTGPITKFTLDIPYLKKCPNIDNLIHFLTNNGIQNIVLKLPIGDRYKLPSSFFSSLHLKHLTLERCLIHPPPVFKGFDRLISLEISHVTISSEFLGSLISHCPLLENLVLEHLDNSNPVEISAPKLRSFFFSGNIHFIHLENVPLLSNVSYRPTEFSVAAEHDLANIFESIPALEYLWWNHFYVQFMVTGPGELPTRFPSALNCLKRLNLSEFYLGGCFELSCALCLIRSSPYLEEIEIKVSHDLGYYLLKPVPQGAIDEIPTSFSDVTFNHLRTVTLRGIAGTGIEMQLIKVLLAKSSALVKMVIDPEVVGDQYLKYQSIKVLADITNFYLKVLAEITKFQRASPKAEVVYNLDWYRFGNPA